MTRTTGDARPVPSALLLAAAATAFLALSSSARAADVTVVPAHAPKGAAVSLSARGLPAGSRTVVRLAGRRVAAVRADRRGKVSLKVRVPRTGTLGRRSLVVRAGRRSVRSYVVVARKALPIVTVTAADSRRVVLRPSSGRSGTRVRLQGRGFGRSCRPSVALRSRVLSRPRLRRGAFSATFTIRSARAGKLFLVVRCGRAAMRVPFVVKPRSGTPPGSGGGGGSTPPGGGSGGGGSGGGSGGGGTGGGSGSGASPVAPGTNVVVPLPFALDFRGATGVVRDRFGVATGFTYIEGGADYMPENLTVDTSAGILRVRTTRGISFRAHNSLDNALAVGLPTPVGPSTVTITVVNPPPGTGHWEQGGLWLGRGQDDYVKLVVISSPDGVRVQMVVEAGNVATLWRQTDPLALGGRAVTLLLTVDGDRASAAYSLDGGAPAAVGSVGLPASLIRYQSESLNGHGTATFAGVFATHRQGPQAVEYAFRGFAITPG